MVGEVVHRVILSCNKVCFDRQGKNDAHVPQCFIFATVVK